MLTILKRGGGVYLDTPEVSLGSKEDLGAMSNSRSLMVRFTLNGCVKFSLMKYKRFEYFNKIKIRLYRSGFTSLILTNVQNIYIT